MEPLTIGELTARLGVQVRTVRFWSDEGLVDPPARSCGGYQLYDGPAVARLDLVRTLRELGLGLPAIRERQQLIDEFVARAFAGVPDDAPGTGIAQGMRTLPAELPDEPTPEQVAAWLELTGLVSDETFATRVREMALAGAAATPEEPDAKAADMGRMQTLGRQALADGVAPGSPEAERLVAELLDDDRPATADRRDGAGRPAGHVHRRPGGAVLAGARRAPRPAGVRAGGARRGVVDRGVARPAIMSR